MSDEKKRSEETVRHPRGKFPTGEFPSIPRVTYEWQEEELSTRLTDTTVTMAPPSQAKGRTRAMLTIISGPGAGRAVSIQNRETVLGRGREAEVRLDDAGASRAHARIISLEEGVYVLEDLQSTNGTFVGGNKVDRVELQSGDRIHIGPNCMISFAILDSQAEIMTHQLYESAMRDPLTRAYNRRYFYERVASELAFAVRHGGLLALIMFDIDHFKRINDVHGHPAGDEVLREVAALITRMIRAEDVFARYGGEEFVLLVRGIDHTNVGRFAERLRMAVERLDVVAEAATIHATISIGYVSLLEMPPDGRNAENLVRLADERLYAAKRGGRNRTCGA